MAKKRPFKTIDIHGFSPDQAKRLIEYEILRASEGAEKILIIHGCNNGTVLRDMVRGGLSSPRIREIMPSFANDGETTIYLNRA